MNDFLYGALTMCAAAIGLFFVRYWRRSRDRLFLAFACSFWMLAVNWGLMLVVVQDESRSWLYIIRIVAFGLLAAAIVDKNSGKAGPPARGRGAVNGKGPRTP